MLYLDIGRESDIGVALSFLTKTEERICTGEERDGKLAKGIKILTHDVSAASRCITCGGEAERCYWLGSKVHLNDEFCSLQLCRGSS